MPAETVPVASAEGQAQWMRELAGQEWVQAIRADGRRNLLTIARSVMVRADWLSLESRPTWEELERASGLSARSVARWLLELRLRGWLELVEHGSTPTTRPASLAALEGNRAAVYALRAPLTPERAAALAAELGLDAESDPAGAAPSGDDAQCADQAELALVEINGTPSLSFKFLSSRSGGGFSRARQPVDNSGQQVPEQGKQKMTALRAGSEELRPPDLLIMVPGSRYEMLVCADELRRQRPGVFGRCSRRLVRALCRPYWRAGWCGRDILHALDHRPSMFGQVSREMGIPPELVSPRQLILGRLRAWQDERGRIRAGYWTSRTRPAASADAETHGRYLVRDRHGRAGARLLRAGEVELTVERIVGHGRAVRTAPVAVLDPRAERDRRRAELVTQARAEMARRATTTAPRAAAWLPMATDPAATIYERARARARAESNRRDRRIH